VSLQAKKPRPKKCRVESCRTLFVPARMGQAVCSPACAIIDAPKNQEKARKAIQQEDRKSLRAAKERVKTKGQYMREAQTAFNAWVRERDATLPCISCGRSHEGQYHAGHYLSVGANPELRFEPMNVHKQCAPCNNHLSGNLVNYRISLPQRIGQEKVDWLEGPHEPKRYTIEDLKAITAEYRAKTRELKRTA
jgi:hypothetical protein